MNTKMSKQGTGPSSDRWQRPPSRGGGLLPQGQGVSSTLSPAGEGEGPSAPPPPSHHRHAYPGAQGPPPPPVRRKSGGREDGAMSGEAGKGRCGVGVQGAQGTSTGDSFSIVHQHDLEPLESCSRSPLLCLICNNVYEDPRLLSCYHSFCAKCLPGRMGDGKIVCPLCGKPTALKDPSGPPTDHLLRFLLHSSPEFHPSCANCDNKSRAPMFYCNTCGQVLCNGCREVTHRAKMFSTHDIIPVSKYTKETPKKCSVHGEQFIMFSNAEKQMLCINCYRDTAIESRRHCVDLDTAYSQGCRKLDRAVISLRDLQVAVRDGITMLKNVLEELRRNSDSEKSAVNAVCQTILDALTKTQENLLKDVACQMDGKDKVIRGQLCQLRSVLPTIKLHLTMCATIASATNKYDFLDLAYPLIDRLTAITHMGYPIRPAQSSQIKSTYKTEIARTLEPWVSGSGAVAHGPPKLPQKQPPKEFIHTTAVEDQDFNEPTYSQYYPMSRSTVTPVMSHKALPGGGYAAPTTSRMDGGQMSGRKTPVAKGKVDGMDDQFAAHCRSFTAHVNELNQRLSRLKEQVQELHRDITLQRGSAHVTRTESALREGHFLEDQLERRHAEMERIRKHLESQWNDNMRQIRLEQEVFQAQINDLLAMKSEVKQVSSLIQQLQSFLKSLSVHPPTQQQSGGGGPPGGPGGGGGGVGISGSGAAGKLGVPMGSSGGQGAIHQGQTGRQQQQHAHHLTTIPPADSFSRAESGSQVTPSLTEMTYLDPSRSGGGISVASQADGLRVISGGQTQSFGVNALNGPSLRQTGKQPGPSSFQPGFTPRPIYGQKGAAGTQQDMDYIQVDTSYTPKAPARPIQGLSSSTEASRKGVLSQLIEKVRSKDDRKKSFASGVSSSSSGGTAPHPPQLPSASAAAARRALTMYDAQCQFGLDSSTSAVSALALANTSLGSRKDGYGSHQQHESRPTYQRAKSFVKSKSDDERLPSSKLSQQSRARSAGQLETESLLRSLSSGSKDASRILELYQSLSKTIIERERESQQLQQRQSYPHSPYAYQYQYETHRYRDDSSGQLSRTLPSQGSRGGSQRPRGQSNSLGRIHSKSPSHLRQTPRPEESLTASEDDYQQIPFNGSKSVPIARSHSAPPRKPSKPTATEVKVFVHEEPKGSSRSRPAPSAPISKSLEESYLYSYLSHHPTRGGGMTSSSSGQSSGFSTAFTGMGKKPASCESIVSAGAAEGDEQSRKSSIDFDRRSVVTVKRAGSKPGLPRQQSWEAGAQLGKREHSLSTPQLSPTADDPFESGRSSVQSEGGHQPRRSRMYDEEEDLIVGSTLHKADSFEGHEEAVRSIVAAVQETRTLQKRLQSN